MAAPDKKYLALPTIVPATPPTQIKYLSHEEAQKLAIRQALGGSIQMIIFEAIEYVEPDVTPEIITAAVKPIPD